VDLNEKLRAGICVHFFENASIKGNLQLNSYYFESDIQYHTAYGLIGDKSDPIQIVFAMPNKSDDVYFMVTDGDPETVAGELAGIQQYNEENEHICLFHTVPTTNKVFAKNKWAAFLTVLPCTVLDDFEDVKTISDRNIRFRLVMPITSEESELKIKSGIDSLMDMFEESDRDIISFVQ
jgi:hypothetical protein